MNIHHNTLYLNFTNGYASSLSKIANRSKNRRFLNDMGALIQNNFTEMVIMMPYTEIAQTVLNPITVYSYDFLFNCMTVGQASDSMTALT